MALATSGTVRDYGRSKHVSKEAIPIAVAGQAVGTASGSNAAVTLVPPSDRGVCLTNIDFAYRTVATAPATIQASDGTLTWGPFNLALAFGLNRIVFDPPLLFTKGATVTVTLLDGTAVKDLMAWGYVEGGGNW